MDGRRRGSPRIGRVEHWQPSRAEYHYFHSWSKRSKVEDKLSSGVLTNDEAEVVHETVVVQEAVETNARSNGEAGSTGSELGESTNVPKQHKAKLFDGGVVYTSLQRQPRRRVGWS